MRLLIGFFVGIAVCAIAYTIADAIRDAEDYGKYDYNRCEYKNKRGGIQ